MSVEFLDFQFQRGVNLVLEILRGFSSKKSPKNHIIILEALKICRRRIVRALRIYRGDTLQVANLFCREYKLTAVIRP